MRYAIYHTPDHNHPLTKAAAQWLGRDAFGGVVSEPEQPTQWSPAEQRLLVSDAARYGFHATLKAPFSLAAQHTEPELAEAFGQLVWKEDLVIPSLELRQIDGFFALVPAQTIDAIQDFAALVVRQFDRFRAPLTPSDIARRNPEKMTERQRGFLENWGYPYVFEEFFFHMTLTSRVPPESAGLVRSVLEKYFADFIGKPHPINHIALFVEPAPGADFSVHSLRPIGGQSSPLHEGQTDDR